MWFVLFLRYVIKIITTESLKPFYIIDTNKVCNLVHIISYELVFDCDYDYSE